MRYNIASVIAMLAVGLFASACTTSMTYGTHPETLDPGEVQGAVMMQTDVSTGPVTQARQTANASKERIENDEPFTEEEFREALDTAVSWFLFKPTVATEASMRVGVVDGLDAGIRYNGATTKMDVKGRLWQSADEKHVLSLTGGAGRQSSAGPSIVENITLREYSRWDADIALMYGAEPFEFLRAYIGPRFVYSWMTVEPKLDEKFRDLIPEEYKNYDPGQFLQDENLAYIGGTAGVMLGYKWIWATLEATVMHMSFEPTIIDQKRDLSGWLIAPVAGLMIEY